MAEVDSDKQGTSAAALGRRYPALPRLLFLLIPVGLAGIFVWLWLANGRLASYQYWCVLLAVASGLVTSLGAFGSLHLRLTRAAWARRNGYAFGISFGMLLMVVLYLTAQGICWLLNELEAARFVRTGSHSTGAIYQSNRVLGYMPRPNSMADAQFAVDGELVFAYTYHTDEFRRRIVPSQHQDGILREKALLFFGGSFTFGEGVSDAASLPNQAALRAPGVAMYNYAFSGYGPNQMLARLESMDTRGELPETDVAAVYLFMPDHVRRVIGASSVIAWARHAPYYELDEAGLPVRLGSFQGERQPLTALYDFLRGDQVLQHYKIHFPWRLRMKHLNLTAATIAQSSSLFKEQFGSTKFYAVLYPAMFHGDAVSGQMRTLLEGRGIEVIDLTQLLGPPFHEHFYLPHDGHPRPETHAAVADALVSRLPFLQKEKTAK